MLAENRRRKFSLGRILAVAIRQKLCEKGLMKLKFTTEPAHVFIQVSGRQNCCGSKVETRELRNGSRLATISNSGFAATIPPAFRWPQPRESLINEPSIGTTN